MNVIVQFFLFDISVITKIFPYYILYQCYIYIIILLILYISYISLHSSPHVESIPVHIFLLSSFSVRMYCVVSTELINKKLNIVKTIAHMLFNNQNFRTFVK